MHTSLRVEALHGAMGMVEDRSGKVNNAFGLAYNRLMADLVPGVALALVVAVLFPEVLRFLPFDGAVGALVTVGVSVVVLAAGLALNFLGFTLFWPAIRRIERALDMGARARRIFDIEAIRDKTRLEGDEWWAFVDRCEDFVLTRHPAWFEPYAHVDGIRKMMRGLALVSLISAVLVLVAGLPADSLGALGLLGLGTGGLVLAAVILVAYSGWMSGYYHSAIVQSVHLNSLIDGRGEFETLVKVRRLASARATEAKVQPDLVDGLPQGR